MIKITVAGEVATAHGPLPFPFLSTITSLAGRKHWNGNRSVKFDATPANIRKLRESDHPIEWDDATGTLADFAELEGMATQHSSVASAGRSLAYEPNRSLYAHQKDALALGQFRASYAYLLEMGLGKTAIAIHNAGVLFAEGKLTGVLILSPKGVHRQWVAEQIPEHLDPRIEVHALSWSAGRKKSKATLEALQDSAIGPLNGKLTFLSLNIDAIRTEEGFNAAQRFLKIHGPRSMMIVDESHLIKNGSAERTKRAWKLGALAAYRRILTGTPIAKNIVDAWSQFKFLDERILGHRYMTSFRARYCVMGGWEGKQIVGQRNTEEFYRLIAPHAFRLTKAEALDLPPKIYVRREYDMSEKSREHYDSLRKTYMTSFDSGEIVDVANAAVAMTRLQQVVCGYLPIVDEEGKTLYHETISDERIDVLLEIARQTEGPTVVWARFIEDGRRICEALAKEFGPGEVAHYSGGDASKEDAKTRFMNQGSRFFVANPAAGGTGLNLQGACQKVIYYSNSFDALHRWQSEDRTHRMGMKGAVTYFDIVAAKSVDRHILRNLQGKKSISNLTFDEIRQAISGG